MQTLRLLLPNLFRQPLRLHILPHQLHLGRLKLHINPQGHLIPKTRRFDLKLHQLLLIPNSMDRLPSINIETW